MPSGERGGTGGIGDRRRRSTFDRIRRNPIRHGLIGLSIAGAAAPVAMARYQRVVRNDPGHEQIMAQSPMQRLTDASVAQAWAEAKVNADAQASASTGVSSERESTIQEKLAKYQQFGLERHLADRIYDLALENDLDPDMAFGLVRTESEFKATAKSHVGARGLTQLMPATARIMRPGTTASDLEDPDV
ncbi:MAG: transglycosylase SLT domain-containing protein, partial [Gemmatimonadetes bacterium]|nr:transglycosylase SLT domain-containing protein [Gemmatimonadota bacterium]